MADAPIQLKKVTPGDVVAVPTGSVGFFAGSDGKFYAKDGSSAAAEIGGVDETAVQDLIDTSLEDYATTADVQAEIAGEKNIANGIAGLDANGDVTQRINRVKILHRVDRNAWFFGDAGTSSGSYIGSNLVAIGDTCCENVTSLSDSVFIGVTAGQSVVTGNGSVAVGPLALKEVTNCVSNTAVGDSSLLKTQGGHNTAIGYAAGSKQINGQWNVFIGAYCAWEGEKGEHNVIIGDYASESGALGDHNILVGSKVLPDGTGDNNIALGCQSLFQSTTASNNISIGYQSGSILTTGTANTFIGHQSGSQSGNQKVDAVNSTAIGNRTWTTKNNQVVIGNADVTETLLRGTVFSGSRIVVGTNLTSADSNILQVGAENPTHTVIGNGVAMVVTYEKSNASNTIQRWATGARYDGNVGPSGRWGVWGIHTDGEWTLPFACKANGDVILNNQANPFTTKIGKVGIKEENPDYQLDVNGTFGFTPGSSVTPVDNGDVVFELTNNTTLTLKAKGSDGTVRSATITLA